VGAAVKFQQLGFKIAATSLDPINKRVAEAVSRYGKPFAA
jgi:hypothetical protein